MPKQTYLQIAEPCHQNWDAMTPQLQGRHCQSCAKTVVDFTLMTDGQILSYMKTAKGETCGRFYNDQLDRALIQPKYPKWYLSGMWKYVISSFLIAKSIDTKAQIKGEVKIEVPQHSNNMKLGKMIAPQTTIKQFVVTGIIKNENLKNLQNVTVKNTRTKIAIVTDQNGAYSIQSKMGDELIFSFEHYKTKRVVVNARLQNIVLEKIEVNNIMMGMIAYERKVEAPEIAFALQKNIVRDAISKEVIPNISVTVLINKKKTQLVTDENGEFVFNKIKPKDSVTITLSSTGYTSKTLTVNGKELQQKGFLQVIYLDKYFIKGDIATVTSYGYRRGGCPRYTTGAVVVGQKINTKRDTTCVNKINNQNLVSGSNNIKTFPNPINTNETLQIQYNSSANEFILIQLTTLEGKIVKMQKEKALLGLNVFKMEMPNIAAQTVIVQVMNSKGKYIATQKIVVL